jgi:hypothetical protein
VDVGSPYRRRPNVRWSGPGWFSCSCSSPVWRSPCTCRARRPSSPYQLSEAESTSTTLSNELESLHRDVEDASSTQRIAAEASRLGMVVPGQSGVLDVNGEEVREVRPADPAASLPVTDINGRTPAQRPTSDPEATGQVPGLAPQALDPGRDDAPAAPGAQQDQQARGADSTGELPY